MEPRNSRAGADLAGDRGYLRAIVREGSAVARGIARHTLDEVAEAMHTSYSTRLQPNFSIQEDRGLPDRPSSGGEQVTNHNRTNAGLRVHGARALAAVAAAALIAACGSSSPSSSRASGSNPSQAQAQQDGLSFSRCMRSHGLSSFPDPTAGGGGFNINVPGMSSSSPAFEAAFNACKALLPVKHVQSQPPTAQAYARLLHWAKCMREHGISGLLDPKPAPPPPPGSPGTAGIGTLMGDGGYWVGIPDTIDAHSPQFTRLSTTCGESPGGHKA